MVRKKILALLLSFLASCKGIDTQKIPLGSTPGGGGSGSTDGAISLSLLSGANHADVVNPANAFNFQVVKINDEGTEISVEASPGVASVLANSISLPPLDIDLSQRSVSADYPVYVLRALNTTDDIEQVYFEAPIFTNTIELSGPATALWLLIKQNSTSDLLINRNDWESMLMLLEEAGCVIEDTTTDCLQRISTSHINALNLILSRSGIVLESADIIGLRPLAVSSQQGVVLNNLLSLSPVSEGSSLLASVLFFDPWNPEDLSTPGLWKKTTNLSTYTTLTSCGTDEACSVLVNYGDYTSSGIRVVAEFAPDGRSSEMVFKASISDIVDLNIDELTLNDISSIPFRHNHWVAINLSENFESVHNPADQLVFDLQTSGLNQGAIRTKSGTNEKFLVFVPRTSENSLVINLWARETTGVARASITVRVNNIQADAEPAMMSYTTPDVNEGVETLLPNIQISDPDGDLLKSFSCSSSGWTNRMTAIVNGSFASSISLDSANSTTFGLSPLLKFKIKPSIYEIEGTTNYSNSTVTPSTTKLVTLPCQVSYDYTYSGVPEHGKPFASYSKTINVNVARILNTSLWPEFVSIPPSINLAATLNNNIYFGQINANNYPEATHVTVTSGTPPVSKTTVRSQENYKLKNVTTGDMATYCNYLNTDPVRYTTIGAYRSPTYSPVETSKLNSPGVGVTNTGGHFRTNPALTLDTVNYYTHTPNAPFSLEYSGFPNPKLATECDVKIVATNIQGMTAESPTIRLNIQDLNNPLSANGTLPAALTTREGTDLSINLLQDTSVISYGSPAGSSTTFATLFNDLDFGNPGDPNECQYRKSHNFASYSDPAVLAQAIGYQIVAENIPHISSTTLKRYFNNKGRIQTGIMENEYGSISGHTFRYRPNYNLLLPSSSSSTARTSTTFSINFYTQDRATSSFSNDCYDEFENDSNYTGIGTPSNISTYKARAIPKTLSLTVVDMPQRPNVTLSGDISTIAEGNPGGTEVAFGVNLTNGDNYGYVALFSCKDPKDNTDAPFAYSSTQVSSIFPSAPSTNIRTIISLASDDDFDAGGDGSVEYVDYPCILKIQANSAAHAFNLDFDTPFTVRVLNTNRPPTGLGVKAGEGISSYDCTKDCPQYVYTVDFNNVAQKTTPLSLKFNVSDPDTGDQYKYSLSSGVTSTVSDFATFGGSSLNFNFMGCPTGKNTRELIYSVKARQHIDGEYVGGPNSSDTTINRSIKLILKNTGASTLQCPF